jgi:hypothetical protein
MTSSRRLFLILCAAAIAAIVSYIAATQTRPARDSTAASATNNGFQLISRVPDGPVVLFRNARPGEFYGRVAASPLPISEAPRMIAPISCDRLHYASGRGVCMVTDEQHLPVRYFAYVFDGSFRERYRVALTGPPIRARVAPNGTRAALTVFEKGHSYADQDFSTRTIVIDTTTGQTTADLEDFPVTKDGHPYKGIDFNFWGLTFAADADAFYATLKTAGTRYLVKGSVDARRMSVVRPDVECPSLSQDGTMIVFKRPLNRGIGWHLTALDVATGREYPLNQSQRSVDDQVDWFDAGHVVYYDSSADGMGVWVLATDGSASQLLLRDAASPAVSR